MGTERREAGTALAELRARTALRAAGLDTTVPLERASSVTNEVWLTATHAVRVNRHPDHRLYREAMVADALPPEVGYPTVVAHGRNGEDWIVLERVPGEPLAHHWPRLTEDERMCAVTQLAVRLAMLHRTKAPPDLPPVEHAPQLLEVGAADPTGPLVDALHRAMRLDNVDAVMLTDAADMVTRLAPALVPFESDTLVHGDVTFENVLWHDGEISALLDMEWAQPGPRDLDLDILLRCSAHPQLHVADAFVDDTHTEDYEMVPRWLAHEYPALFEARDQLDRLRVFSIAYDVRDLLASPPQVARRELPNLHAYNRLQRVVSGRSYLDDLARWL